VPEEEAEEEADADAAAMAAAARLGLLGGRRNNEGLGESNGGGCVSGGWMAIKGGLGAVRLSPAKGLMDAGRGGRGLLEVVDDTVVLEELEVDESRRRIPFLPRAVSRGPLRRQRCVCVVASSGLLLAVS